MDSTLDKMPLLSIIIPCYNDAAFIEQAVASALQQTYKNTEIIIVDDGSNAETKAILKTLAPQLQLITQENKGQSAARNCGVKAASGAYILVLDSDDYVEHQFCEMAVKLINTENVALVTCNALIHSELKDDCIFQPKGGELSDFLFANQALGNCALFRKEDWLQIGGYDETMRQGWEDWEFYIRLMQLGGRCEVIPEVLFHYRKRENTTTDKANNQKYELYKYIFTKHKDLYTNHYEKLVEFLLIKIDQEEQEKVKNRNRIDFLVGKKILAPFRFIKSKLK
jgi:hypothetical protein